MTYVMSDIHGQYEKYMNEGTEEAAVSIGDLLKGNF